MHILRYLGSNYWSFMTSMNLRSIDSTLFESQNFLLIKEQLILSNAKFVEDQVLRQILQSLMPLFFKKISFYNLNLPHLETSLGICKIFSSTQDHLALIPFKKFLAWRITSQNRRRKDKDHNVKCIVKWGILPLFVFNFKISWLGKVLHLFLQVRLLFRQCAFFKE